MAVPDTAQERREVLTEVYREARVCERCPHLAQTRTQVVFGAGNADADLMFVGEAPGADEDRDGVPFVGRAGKLLTELLAGIGIAREDVFIANVLKCRPARQPQPDGAGDRELLGVAVPAARADPADGRRHARQLRHEAAARRPDVDHEDPRAGRGAGHRARAPCGCSRSCTRRRRSTRRPTREVLAADFALIPALLALGPPPQPGARRASPSRSPSPSPQPEPEPVAGRRDAESEAAVEADDQLGLF